MRIIAGMGASACLALALAGCVNKCGVESVDCSVAQPVATRTVTLSTTTAATPIAGTPTVAVMPFIGVGDAPGSGILVADAMARQLRGCADCVVIAPETMATRAGVRPGDEWDPVDAGRRLGAPYVITGRVTDYAVGDGGTGKPMVGLAVRLIETKTGTVVWTGDGSKSAPELPDGGLDTLAYAACGGLAKTIHDNLDKTVIPDAATKALAEAKAPVVPAPAPALAQASAPAPLPVFEDKQSVAKAIPKAEALDIAEAPPRNLGEGTADWAVPLEKMPDYLKSIGADAPALAAGTADLGVSVDPSVEGVGSVLGMEREEDMAGALLVPGAITIDLTGEDVRPEEFGVQGADPVSAPSTPGPIGEVPGGVVAEAPKSLRPAQTISPQEAARMLDMFEDLSAAPDSMGMAPPAPVALDKGEGEGEFSTQFMVNYSLELENDDEESFDDKFSVDSVDLDFFGSLSESLDKDSFDG